MWKEILISLTFAINIDFFNHYLKTFNFLLSFVFFFWSNHRLSSELLSFFRWTMESDGKESSTNWIQIISFLLFSAFPTSNKSISLLLLVGEFFQSFPCWTSFNILPISNSPTQLFNIETEIDVYSSKRNNPIERFFSLVLQLPSRFVNFHFAC